MNFGNKMFRVFGSAVLLVLAACAGDKSQSQYQSQLAQQDLAAYQAVAKSYVGTCTDAQGQTLAAANLTLNASMQTTSSTTGTGQQSNPVLTGSMNLDGVVTADDISIINASYDPNSNIFSGALNIPSGVGPYASIAVNIYGQIGGGSFSGTVKLNSSNSEQIFCNLNTGGQATVSDYATTQRAQQLSSMGTKLPVAYRGNPMPVAGGKTAIPVLIVEDPGTSGEAQLFNLLSPKRLVSVYVNQLGPELDDKGNPLPYSQAFINTSSAGNTGASTAYIQDVYDANGGYRGQTINAVQVDSNCTSGGGNCQVTLSCTSFAASAGKSNGFSCTEIQPHGSDLKNIQYYLVQDPTAKQ